MAEHPLRLAMGASKESGLVYKPRYRINIKNVNFGQEERTTGVLKSQSPPLSRPVPVAQPTVARAQSVQHIGFPPQGHRSTLRRNSCSWFLELCLTLSPLIVVIFMLRHQMGEMFAPKQFNANEIPVKSMKNFADVKGCNEAKSELEEIVQYLRNPDKFTRLGGKLPKGVLLTGPPGTGKTLLAKAIAGEAGVPFFYRAGSEFEEVFVGVGARRVRSLFQAAKKSSPCVIFIDEIDAIGGNRKLSRSEHKETLNQLLVEMDGFEASEGVIVLASTNLPDTLDPALTRPGRFDRRVVLPNPDVKGRQEILDLYLQNKPLCDEVDTKTLARGTPGFTGADLANLVNMAAVKAAVDGSDKVCSDQLEFAKDKILMGAERSHLTLSEESRKLTAYHEGGHVVVAFHTVGADPIHKATILPRGAALGMVIQLPDHDETSISKMQLLARLDVYMGGRVAEEMIFGADQVTTGARSDLEKATALARSMVSECGMSESVGPIFVNQESQRRPSQETQKNIDAEVVRLLKEAYERVGKLLKKHEADIHSLARALLEQETLNSKQITDILKQENPAVVEVSSNLSQTDALLGLSDLISFA